MRALQFLWLAILAGSLGGCPKPEDCNNNQDDDRDNAVDCDDSDCSLAPGCGFCGDGAPGFDEECDDGDDNDNNACTNVCALNVCGDGSLFIGFEQCDDGNNTPGDSCGEDCSIEPSVFASTGDAQSFVVPEWANAILVEAWGAQGEGSACCDPPNDEDGGLGGYAAGVISVSAGTEVFVFVGGQGGYNGGGAGGQWGGGGGGASDVRIGGVSLSARVLVAGGGGGGNNCGCPDHGYGGAGGGLEGEPGGSNMGLSPGGGGTQISGGAAGEGAAQAGSFGVGGSFIGDSYHIGGGGGGWFGGGSAYAAGGGGGSSFIGALPQAVTEAGVQSGYGLVIVTPIVQ